MTFLFDQCVTNQGTLSDISYMALFGHLRVTFGFDNRMKSHGEGLKYF